jgi:NNP family nitrate/nitrite transporter-like MFS transporter
MYFSEIRKSPVLGKEPLLIPSPISSIAQGEEHVRSANA